MARILVKGPTRLEGRLKASGAKNACLPILAASILARGEVSLKRVPDISDVHTMLGIMQGMGVKARWTGEEELHLDTTKVTTTAPDELVRQMNASFDLAGPLLACYGEAHISLPGGCRLGPRPVDLHLQGFRKLGATVSTERGAVHARADRLKGAHIAFPFVSVGATKNCMMASVLAEGETILENCAMEPEIVDLADFLVAMGARIEGQGSSQIRVQGVQKMHGVEYGVLPDRIETGTFLIAAVMTGGDITVEDCRPEDLTALIGILRDAGQEVEVGKDWIRVRGVRPVLPVEIATAPHPGFPTDLHPQMVAMLALANGSSVLNETIFSGRFMYAMELVRLGANLKVRDRQVFITGNDRYSSAPVDAPDLRAGAALILAGMAGEGETLISGVHFIDRGYQKLEERLRSLGADITRLEQPIPSHAG
jgi:UDP-N-acetylglucosamine 1-carboxyvinyltransferase